MGKKRGNGEGSIVKVKDNQWRGAVVIGRDLDGKVKRKWFTGKTRKEVADKMHSILAMISTGNYVEPSKTSFGDCWMFGFQNIKSIH